MTFPYGQPKKISTQRKRLENLARPSLRLILAVYSMNTPIGSGMGIVVFQCAGVAVRVVNPAYTSQRCFACGHIESANRKANSCLSTADTPTPPT